MLVTPVGIVMLPVKPVQPENAPFPDAGEVCGKGEVASQAGAARKRICPDAGEACGEGEAACQAGAAIECTCSDGGDAGRDVVTSSKSLWIFDDRGLVFIEQHPTHTAIGWVVWIH